jgi:glycine hydroxymethyltransferase
MILEGVSVKMMREIEQINELTRQEEARQSGCLRLIASENYASKAVMEANASCLTNRYSEGYPGKRYYEGQQVTDIIEEIARQRAKALFKADHANVQPYSGSVANLAAYLAVAEPGDTIMGIALPEGGHLTHGWKVSITGKIFKSAQYGVDHATGRFDYNVIAELAKKNKPKIIITGATAYPREIDFEAFGQIAKDAGAYHVADIAHIAGLVAAGVHKSPVPYADIVSTTTHKTLRGPRGGMIMCKAEFAAKVDKSVFPGMQGGPHMNTIASLAIALAEASTPEFVEYGKQIIKNARALAEKLMEYGFNLVSGGTDNHLILIDLRNKNIPGRKLAKALDRARIITNCNTVPGDTAPPFNPSGLRIGTPSITSRGMKEAEARQVAEFIKRVAENIDNQDELDKVGSEVLGLCSRFPVPEDFIAAQKNDA